MNKVEMKKIYNILADRIERTHQTYSDADPQALQAIALAAQVMLLLDKVEETK